MQPWTAINVRSTSSLGIGLSIGGIGYLANILATVTPTAIRAYLFPYIMLPAGVAETALTLWLLIMGMNVQKWDAVARTAQARE
jgi:Domain of unknown function (DUF4386)